MAGLCIPPLAALRFNPPDWPVTFAALAGGLLAVEVGVMLAGLLKRHSPTSALALTVGGLLAGPLLALGGLIVRVMSADLSARPAGRDAIVAGLHGTAITVLALLIVFSPAAGGAAAIAVIAAIWAVRSYRRTTAPVTPATRRTLLALRITAVALLALWVLQPSWRSTWTEDIRGTILIAVDTSRSMQQPDAGADPSRLQPRIDAARNALQRNAGKLSALAGDADVQLFTFDEQAASPQLLLPRPAEAIGPADGTATAIGDSLQQTTNALRAAGADLRTVVLITDGCSNISEPVAPDAFAARMATRGIPVHAVRTGSEQVNTNMQALSVSTVGAPSTVSAFRRMAIEPTIDAIGLAGRSIRVTCRFGETALPPKTFSPTDRRDSRTLRFEHTPLDAGFHRLTVTAELLGEQPHRLAGSPSADQLVQVVDRDIRILYLEGRFRYEMKYIAAAVGTLDRVSLHRLVLLQPLRQSQALGNELDDWMRYHAIIFGSVSPSTFTPEQLQIVHTLVDEYGKGFCMIGGRQSFGAGGWADTPIADILPVDIGDARGQIDADLRPLPTTKGRDNPLMQIGPDDAPLAPWNDFDALPGANELGRVKPAATVLAEADGQPMIVAGRFGKGRTLAIAFDTTWRWVLSPKETADAQKRFWRQVALYLADPRGKVWIHASRPSYDLRSLRNGSQDVEITAGVTDSRGLPATDITPTVTLTTPDGRTSPINLARDDHRLAGTLPPPSQPGLYTLKIAATVEGKDLTSEYPFEVVRRDLEAADVLANGALLRRIADETGGRFVPVEDFASLLPKLAEAAQPRQREVHDTRDLLAPLRWPIVLLAIALLCTEWAWRKRKGLV